MDGETIMDGVLITIVTIISHTTINRTINDTQITTTQIPNKWNHWKTKAQYKTNYSKQACKEMNKSNKQRKNTKIKSVYFNIKTQI